MRQTVKFKDYIKRLFVRYTIALISLMVITFIALMVLNYRLLIMKANEDCNQLVSSFISAQYTIYQQGIETFSANEAVKNVLLGKGELRDANRLLYEFCLAQQIKSNFILLDQNGEIVTTNLYKTNQMLLLANRSVKDLLARIHNEPGTTFRSVVRIPFDNGQQANMMFAKTVHADDGQIIGYLLFNLQEDSLSAFLRNRDADIIVITDRFNNVIFSTNSLIIDSMGKYQPEQESDDSATIDQKPYYVTTTLLPERDSKIITMTSGAKQKQFVQFGGIFLFGVSCFLILLVRVLADKVNARNIKAIDELLYAVSECRQGNIDYRIQSHTFDEFQTLYDDYNNAMVTVQQLIENNNELAERKRWMEVKHLEAQFNPHFVFNVLETLRYVIMTNPDQASKMVVSFANLMRYSINYGSMHVSLKTDIGYVQDYLLLQKMRYSQRLEYTIDIDEPLLQCKVPKLLIQPIVENSVVHGLENAGKLIVHITGRMLGNDLVFCVEDDGPGMSEEQLAALRVVINDENAMPKRIGLYNVHRAAQLLYGKDYGLTIESGGEKGLRVMLKIPMILEEDHV